MNNFIHKQILEHSDVLLRLDNLEKERQSQTQSEIFHDDNFENELRTQSELVNSHLQKVTVNLIEEELTKIIIEAHSDERKQNLTFSFCIFRFELIFSTSKAHIDFITQQIICPSNFSLLARAKHILNKYKSISITNKNQIRLPCLKQKFIELECMNLNPYFFLDAFDPEFFFSDIANSYKDINCNPDDNKKIWALLNK